MTRLSRLYGKLLDALAILAALILLGMVLVVTGDILLRNFAVRGFPWANEVSEYALYAMTVLAAPWLLRRGQHVRIDLALTVLPSRAAWVMEAIADVLGFLVCAVLLRYSLFMAAESHRLGSITIKNLVFPEWWLLASLPLCFLLLALEFVFRFDRLMRGPRERRVETISVS